MSAAPSASVIIVSRHRPGDLRRCLRALSFQTMANFEVIVVGDPSAVVAIETINFQDKVKHSLFDEPNISKARNIGLGLAAADIVAFIDDDAVAEPTWLERLIQPFSQPNVAAAGGYVRGRNGISFQWKAEAIGRSGDSEPIEVQDTTVLEGTDFRAIKTQGTNCAFRKPVLLELGGFDENYHFYMDETDMNVRIGQAGYLTAIVPGAEVQHGYAESARRTRNRAPRTLFDIGASRAYFLKKYGQDLGRLIRMKAHQRSRLLRFMVDGELEPGDVSRLLDGFEKGVHSGLKRGSIKAKIPEIRSDFVNFAPSPSAEHQVFFARRRQHVAAFRLARKKSKQGIGVTVILLSRSSFFHRRWFHEDGFWVQSGGLFGKSLRSDPLIKRYTPRDRAEREYRMLSATRNISGPPQRV